MQMQAAEALERYSVSTKQMFTIGLKNGSDAEKQFSNFEIRCTTGLWARKQGQRFVKTPHRCNDVSCKPMQIVGYDVAFDKLSQRKNR